MQESRESFIYILEGFVIFFGLIIFLVNGLGLFLKLVNVLIYGGAIDYSSWVILRVAEKPWPDLIFSFISAIFILSIYRNVFHGGKRR